jgi:pyruvate dehydrogenase E1 component alpha subunit
VPIKTVDLETRITHLSILDEKGNVDEELEPSIPEEDLLALFKTMLLTREFDERKEKLQRQGRIGTFAPVRGQEAAQLGSIYALRKTDWFVPSFRETAATIWRGMRLEDDLVFTAGYEEGLRFTKESRDLPIAVPVASQIPHGVGIAWGIQLKGVDDVVLTFFGDGATSEGDFHEALNFAQVFELPVIFLCQNNRWAISVPLHKQTHSKTLAQKGIAYGMRSLQVDGNDILAVYVATREAVERARKGKGPTFIEALTYRLSFHTTADDPTKYRPAEEVKEWEKRDPLPRFQEYLIKRGHLDEDMVKNWTTAAVIEVDHAVERFERRLDGNPDLIFEHAYAKNPPYVERQRREVEDWVRARREEEGGD